MGNLEDILKNKIKDMGIGRQVEAVGVVEKATEEIAKFIPREDFEVISYNRGILKLKTVSPTVSMEINNLKTIQLKRVKRVIFVN